MTNAEKSEKLIALLSPEPASADEVLPYIELSEFVVLNRRYPFGVPEGATVEPRYENIQIQIALCLWNRRDAEGQTGHSENGINRTWASDAVPQSFLSLITPRCESVVGS